MCVYVCVYIRRLLKILSIRCLFARGAVRHSRGQVYVRRGEFAELFRCLVANFSLTGCLILRITFARAYICAIRSLYICTTACVRLYSNLIEVLKLQLNCCVLLDFGIDY